MTEIKTVKMPAISIFFFITLPSANGFCFQTPTSRPIKILTSFPCMVTVSVGTQGSAAIARISKGRFNFLKKKGEGLHHVCFITTNVNDATNTLVDNSARLTSKPRPGDTFNDELIAFLYVRFGLNIELIHTNERRDLISLE